MSNGFLEISDVFFLGISVLPREELKTPPEVKLDDEAL